MTFKEFIEKIKKPALIISGAAIVIAGIVYFIPDEEEQKNTKQQQQQLQQQQQQQQQLGQTQGNQSQLSASSGLGNSQLSPEEMQRKEKIMQDTLKLKQNLQQDIKLEYNEQGYLTLQCVKIIYHRSVMLGLAKLTLYHQEFVKQRQAHFDDLIAYTQITNQLYDFYYKTLNQSLLTVIILLEVREDTFALSKKFYEERQELKPNYLRDLTWHFMSEQASKKDLTLEEYKQYLQFQCDIIQKQADVLNNHEKLKAVDSKAKKLVINSRVDDVAEKELGISDCDAIKALRNYITDPDVTELLKVRTETLDKCC